MIINFLQITSGFDANDPAGGILKKTASTLSGPIIKMLLGLSVLVIIVAIAVLGFYFARYAFAKNSEDASKQKEKIKRVFIGAGAVLVVALIGAGVSGYFLAGITDTTKIDLKTSFEFINNYLIRV